MWVCDGQTLKELELFPGDRHAWGVIVCCCGCGGGYGVYSRLLMFPSFNGKRVEALA